MYSSGLDMMEGISTKKQWLRLPPKPNDAKLICWKSIFRPGFGVHSTQTLVKIYNWQMTNNLFVGNSSPVMCVNVCWNTTIDAGLILLHSPCKKVYNLNHEMPLCLTVILCTLCKNIDHWRWWENESLS